MYGTNLAVLCGTLGREPDAKVFPNGSEVSNFTIAVVDPNTKETVWHRVTAKGQVANACNNRLQKSTMVTVIGHITYRKYTDNSNIERDVTEIFAHRVDIMANGKNPNEQFNDYPQNQQNGFQHNNQQHNNYQHNQSQGGYNSTPRTHRANIQQRRDFGGQRYQQQNRDFNNQNNQSNYHRYQQDNQQYVNPHADDERAHHASTYQK